MSLLSSARELASLLQAARLRVVFAESCTAGLVSASLARVSGISQWHCGSAVVYRGETKTAWLGVSPRTLARHSAVSEPIARQMALGVLKHTPEAHLAASITGHLGPDAPADVDGVVYIGIARRKKSTCQALGVTRHELEATSRYRRQREAAELVLGRLIALLG